MQVKILAFDPGTANMGYSALEGNTRTSEVYITPNFGVLKSSKWDSRHEEVIPIRERLDLLGNQVRELIKKLEPDYMAMEDFVEQGKRVGTTYKEMAFLTEHMRLLGRDMGIDVAIYANGYWKKQTMKATHVNKLQVQHFIGHKLPEAVEMLRYQPDHVWDSAGIGYCRWLELLKAR